MNILNWNPKDLKNPALALGSSASAGITSIQSKLIG